MSLHLQVRVRDTVATIAGESSREVEAGAGLTLHCTVRIHTSASKSSIRRFVITEKAPTRAFFWLKAATTAFTFKTLLRHYAKQVDMKFWFSIDF